MKNRQEKKEERGEEASKYKDLHFQGCLLKKECTVRVQVQTYTGEST